MDDPTRESNPQSTMSEKDALTTWPLAQHQFIEIKLMLLHKLNTTSPPIISAHLSAVMSSSFVLDSSTLMCCLAWSSDCSCDCRFSNSILSNFCERRFLHRGRLFKCVRTQRNNDFFFDFLFCLKGVNWKLFCYYRVSSTIFSFYTNFQMF